MMMRNGSVRRGFLATAVTSTLLALGSGTGSAQGIDWGRVQVEVGLGYEIGGASSDLLDAMEAAGLNETRPERCVLTHCEPARDHPYTSRSGFDMSVTFGVLYPFGDRYFAEVLGANGLRGRVSGFTSDLGDLELAYSNVVLGGLAGYSGGRLRVAVGPAVLRTKWTATRIRSGEQIEEPVFTPGAILHARYMGEYRGTEVGLALQLRGFLESEAVTPFSDPLSSSYSSLTFGMVLKSRK